MAHGISSNLKRLARQRRFVAGWGLASLATGGALAQAVAPDDPAVASAPAASAPAASAPAAAAPSSMPSASSPPVMPFGTSPHRSLPGGSLSERPTPMPAAVASAPQSGVVVPPFVPPRGGAPSVIDERWRASLDAFAASDKLHAPAAGGVLFVGSSSIRLWNDLETQFQTASVIKRGFGGSRMSDCARYVANLVLPYRPRLVVVYAGDNDLAEGQAPEDVLASFKSFAEQVRADLPATRIAYLSIKPSPLRAALIPPIVRTNALIAQYLAGVSNSDFIDIYTKMLDAEGRPRAELFLPDGLHLNADGYAIWKTVISAHLGAPAPLATVSPPLLSK